MDISNPLRLSDAPPGTRRCVCRDMDGEEHCHVHSEAQGDVDVRVKRQVVDGALRMAAAGGEPSEAPEGFVKMNFDRYSPSEAQETLSAVARIFQVNAGLPAHELDTLVTKWKHQGYRQDIHSEDDNAELLGPHVPLGA
eukprot:Skav207830  [mRNA]  locus=scaffold3131:150924:157049:- [translate_table: standard]